MALQDGRTALSVAVTCDSESAAKLVTLLIDNGANPNIADKDGMSPLLIAAFEGKQILLMSVCMSVPNDLSNCWNYMVSFTM